LTVNAIMSNEQVVLATPKGMNTSDTSFQSILMASSGQVSEGDVKPDEIKQNDQKNDVSKSDEAASTKTLTDEKTDNAKAATEETSADTTEDTGTGNVSKTDDTAAKTDKEESKNAVTAAGDEQEEVSETEDAQSIDMINQVLSVIEAILEKLSDLLSISEEELQNQLSDAGIEVTQLTDKNVLQQLILKMNGSTDTSLFLTDETLSKSLKGIFEEVSQILDQAGISLEDFNKVVNTEDFQEIMKQIVEFSDENETTFTEALQSLQEYIQQPEDETIQPETVTVKELVLQNEPAMSKGQTVVDLSSTGENETQPVQNNTGATENRQDSGTSDAGTGESNTAFADFVQNLSSIKQTAESGTVQNAGYQDLAEIANQIIEQVKVKISPEQTSMELQLNPESLGKVTLLVSAKEGVMTAQMMTQNQVAKEAIESQIGSLYETLQQQGLKVDAIEVTVAGFGFNMNKETNSQQQEQQNSKKSVFSTDDDVFNSADDQDLSEIYLGNSTVNYVA